MFVIRNVGKVATRVATRHASFPLVAPATCGIARFSTYRENISPMDIEKELFKIKRQLGSSYSKGLFEEALMHAQHLERKVSHHVGTDNAIHASCWNNIALMQKSLGNLKEAMESYEKALKMYEKAVTKKHVSYINTLMNFGVLHKSFADIATTEEDHNNYLSDARRLIETAIEGLVTLKGEKDKDVLVGRNHLASVLRALGDFDSAERMLRQTLEVAEATRGRMDTLVGLTLNNMGLLYKLLGNVEQSKVCYSEALFIRRELNGEKHQDTLVTMHNLAELLLSMGQTQEANKIQEEILTLYEANLKKDNKDNMVDDVLYDNSDVNAKGAVEREVGQLPEENDEVKKKPIVQYWQP